MQNKDSKLWTFHQTDNADNFIIGHPRQDMLVKKIIGKVGDGNILEIGFGDGYLLEKLSQKYKCFGADISSENVEQMKIRMPKVVFALMGVDGSLPYDDNFFDGFIASEVLEHMTDDELSRSIYEIRRTLKKGGYAFVTFPAMENLKDSECFCPNCEEVFHRWGHKQTWNEEKIKKIFSGFSSIYFEEFFTPYEGCNKVEKIIGYGMFLLRTALNKIIPVPGKSFLVILRK